MDDFSSNQSSLPRPLGRTHGRKIELAKHLDEFSRNPLKSAPEKYEFWKELDEFSMIRQ